MGANHPLKQGGDKPIQIDLASFKKKSINQQVSQVELAHHLKQLEQKQNEIKKYKYWEDFDRISNEYETVLVSTPEQTIDNFFKYALFMSIVGTKYYITYVYRSQHAWALYKRYFFPILGSICLVGSILLPASQPEHPIQGYFYRETAHDEKGYRALDQQMNLYKYVDDIKYNFDYSKSNILKTRQTWHKDYLTYMEQEIINTHLNKDSEDKLRL